MHHGQQVPSLIQDAIAHVTDNVTVAAVFSPMEIAGPDVVTQCRECATGNPRRLTGDKDAHHHTHPTIERKAR